MAKKGTVKIKASKKDIEIKSGKHSIKIKANDYLTIAIVVIVLAVAVLWYFYNQDEKKDQYTALSTIFTGVTDAQTDELNIHFIDVGQGDSIFVEFPDGKNMLIDSGDRGKGDIVVDYLRDLKIEKIDLLIATHTDSDHIGGMKEVFDAFEISFCLRPFVYYSGSDKEIFDPSFNMLPTAKTSKYCDTKTYKTFLDCILEENCGYEYFNKDSDFVQKFTFAEVEYEYSVDFLTPTEEVPNIGYYHSNDYSPVFILTYGEFNAMFTGDAEVAVENEIITYYASIPKVDLLKVGHHGSESSTSREFLQRILPTDAIIPCGNNKTYNHPRQQTLDSLIEINCKIYRTDLQGEIKVCVGLNGEYNITTQKSASITELHQGKDAITG